MGLNEAWFWVGLTTFGTGIYFLIDGTKRRWAASITTLIGVVAMAYSIYAHSHGGMLGLPIWFYLLCVSWVLIGLDVYDRHFRPIAEPSNPAFSLPKRDIIELTIVLAVSCAKSCKAP